MTSAKIDPDSPLAERFCPSPNHGERHGAAPDCVVLHYTGMADALAALNWLTNPVSEVSCHYFVYEDGRIWQLVPERRRAWHAGKSFWQGETDMNSRSIGIEIVNAGHDLSRSPPQSHACPDFPDIQIEAVIRLVQDIVARWKIRPERVLAHSDIAPGRKIDPGEKFPWPRLAEAGLGLWPGPGAPAAAPARRCQFGDEGPAVGALQAMLAAFGFDIAVTGTFDRSTEAAVAAFQRHWRPALIDGIAESETQSRLRALLARR